MSISLSLSALLTWCHFHSCHSPCKAGSCWSPAGRRTQACRAPCWPGRTPPWCWPSGISSSPRGWTRRSQSSPTRTPASASLGHRKSSSPSLHRTSVIQSKHKQWPCFVLFIAHHCDVMERLRRISISTNKSHFIFVFLPRRKNNEPPMKTTI